MPDLLSKNRPIIAVAVLLPILALVPACGSTPSGTSGAPGASASAGSGEGGCITDFDESKDYFPDKVSFEDATNISVEYKKSYKVVTIKQPSPGAAPESYVFVQCGAPEPTLQGDLAKATKVSIPVKRVAAGSTTHVPAFELLDRTGALAAVSSAEKLSEGPAKDAVDSGQIKSIKNANGEVDVENLVSLAPDLYVTSGMAGPENAKIAELKIPVVANAEWLEKTALGRAEWTKYTALYLNREKQANEVYGKIKADYQAVAAKASGVTERPQVLLGSMTKGTWYASAADSYVANEIKDAGGEYVLKDAVGVGSQPLDLEVVLAKSAKAQFWIGATPVSPWKSLADPVKDDPRLGNLTPVKNGNVWTFTKKMTPGGGNDYWQSGVVRPDLVLADLVAILHPELMPNHEFTYTEKVPKA